MSNLSLLLSVLLSVIISYLLGSINTSIIVSRCFGVSDIRKKGSGNAGATNTLRVLGAKAASLVVIGDALKGVLAIYISRLLSACFFSAEYVNVCSYFSSVAVVLGHVFPIYFKL